ncbi:hypothetical protein [Nocardia exalbida]|uniref:hypothetical protein n=1 Tax=Nocardia exalbida TaxID=290231 RepID=UPI001C3F4467|nr:hypothetical protein [Nocardia exalbida]
MIDDLAQRLTGFDGLVAELARAMTAHCPDLTQQVNDLERQLRDRVRALAPSLLAVPGYGVPVGPQRSNSPDCTPLYLCATCWGPRCCQIHRLTDRIPRALDVLAAHRAGLGRPC